MLCKCLAMRFIYSKHSEITVSGAFGSLELPDSFINSSIFVSYRQRFIIIAGNFSSFLFHTGIDADHHKYGVIFGTILQRIHPFPSKNKKCAAEATHQKCIPSNAATHRFDAIIGTKTQGCIFSILKCIYYGKNIQMCRKTNYITLIIFCQCLAKQKVRSQSHAQKTQL